MSNVMVVARYKEDLSWVDRALDISLFDMVEVYNKGPDDLVHPDPRVKIRKVPNLGREGGTYLDYVIENHGNLPGGIWFTQGDPFDHSPDFMVLLREAGQYKKRPFQSLTQKFKYAPPPHHLRTNDAFNLGEGRCSHYFVNYPRLKPWACHSNSRQPLNGCPADDYRLIDAAL